MKKIRLLNVRPSLNTLLDYSKRWCVFLNERFDPLSYAVMIATFVLAHVLISGASFSGPYLSTFFKKFLCGIFLSFIFFLKLRLFDEIKDYETDLVINPTRPLPRGLLSVNHLKKVILCIIVLEIIFILIWAPGSLFILLLTILYSLLMFNEFFIGSAIRPHLTTYALLHTVVSVPFSLTVLCALGQVPYCEIPFEQKMFALLSWPLFNIFEFGRKSFLKSEERANVESYTSLFGKLGACALIATQVFFALFCLYQIPQLIRPYFINYLSILIILFTLIMIAFIVFNQKNIGVVFRFFSSLFIVLIYSGVVLTFLN